MRLEISTGSYNDRRYGKPWIAKVSFETAKGSFVFGEWFGDVGEEGFLEIEAEPGDVIARGQKDFRKPINSAPGYYLVKEGGGLKSVTKVEAVRAWRAKQAKEAKEAKGVSHD